MCYKAIVGDLRQLNSCHRNLMSGYRMQWHQLFHLHICRLREKSFIIIVVVLYGVVVPIEYIITMMLCS